MNGKDGQRAPLWQFVLVPGLCLGLAATVWAHGNKNKNQSSAYYQSDEMNESSGEMSSSELSSGNQMYSSSENPQNLNLSANSRFRVGIDTNGDGVIDTWACVYGSDLNQALSDTWSRDHGKGIRLSGGFGQQRIEGTLLRLRTVNFGGQDRVMAKIKTSSGFSHVNLGPKDQISKLNLNRGDRVVVYGNTRQIVRADRIESGGRQVTINWPGRGRFRPQRGEILQSSTQDINNEQHTIAQVKLDDGRQVSVDLGKTQDLQNQNVNLAPGKRIGFLSSPRQLDNRFVANSFRLDGQTYRVPGQPSLMGTPVSPEAEEGTATQPSGEAPEEMEQSPSGY